MRVFKRSRISINNFITTFNFIEQRNEIGSTHILSNTTEYKVDENRSLKFSTRLELIRVDDKVRKEIWSKKKCCQN